LLTERFGKITGIAKGALRSRKRFVNSLEPFSLVNLRFQERAHSDLAFILGADLTHGFCHLTSTLEAISHASYMVEITDGLTAERDENVAVFEHLKEGLRLLDENGVSLRFLTIFELKLLKLVGYQPVLDACKRCGGCRIPQIPALWHFSPAEGGILCEICARARRETFPLGAMALEILAALQSEPSPLPIALTVPFSVAKEVRAAIMRIIQYHVDREIKSAPFLYHFLSV
jgi:DNA repair protein RecO (recombination protein O)